MEKALQLLTDKLQDWILLAVEMVPNMAVAAFVFVVFLFVSRLTRTLLLKLLSRLDANTAATRLIAQASGIGMMLLGLFVVLTILHLDKAVTSLLAGAGVMGVVIGFAFQEISANFVSGVIIAFQKPYQVGDVVEAKGFLGAVQEIGLRATVLLTFDGLHVIVPNKYFLTEPLINFTLTPDRRIVIEVGVSYAEDLDHVQQVLLGVLAECDELLPGRAQEAYAHKFGDSSITFLVRAWIEYPGTFNYFRIPDQIIRGIRRRFTEEGITIPFPIRTLDFGIKEGEKLREELLAVNEEVPIRS